MSETEMMSLVFLLIAGGSLIGLVLLLKAVHRSKKSTEIPKEESEAQKEENETQKEENRADGEEKKNKPNISLIVASCLAIGTVAGLFIVKSQPAYDSFAQSVVMVKCYDRTGELDCTGGGVQTLGEDLIVTNYHVISGDCWSIFAVTEDQTAYEAVQVVAADEASDLAILKLEQALPSDPLEIGEISDLQRGDKVIAIESSPDLPNTISEGILSGFQQAENMRVIQTTAAVSQGSSGGALLNRKGQLIGITYAGTEEGQEIGFAIPADEIEKVWEQNRLECSVQSFHEHYGAKTVYQLKDVLSSGDTFHQETIEVKGYIISDIDENGFYLSPYLVSYNDVDLKKAYDSGNALFVNLHYMAGRKEIPGRFSCGDYVKLTGYLTITTGDTVTEDEQVSWQHYCMIAKAMEKCDSD